MTAPLPVSRMFRGQPRRSRHVALAGAVAAACALPAAAQQQPAPGGEFNIGAQLNWEDDEFSLGLPINMQVIRATRSQQLRFSAALPIRIQPGGEDVIDLPSAQAGFFWRRESRQAALDFQANYLRTELDQLRFDDSTDLVVLDEGQRQDTDLRLGVEFGRASRFGGTFSVGMSQRDYRDTTERSLVDNEGRDAELTLRAQVSPLIEARAGLSTLEIDSDPGGTDTTEHRATLGAGLIIDKVTTADVELGYSRIERDRFLFGDDSVEGVTASFTLSRARRDGQWTLGYITDPATAGRRHTIEIGRTILREAGDLSFGLGATKREGGSIDAVFRLSANQQLNSTAAVNVNLQRQAVTDEDGDEAINTDFQASYIQQVGEATEFRTGVLYRETDYRSGPSPDASRYGLDLLVSHAFTSKWTLTAGYEGTRSRNDAGERSDDDRVFLGLGTTYQWRP